LPSRLPRGRFGFVGSGSSAGGGAGCVSPYGAIVSGTEGTGRFDFVRSSAVSPISKRAVNVIGVRAR
jgi:hypothetical protein